MDIPKIYIPKSPLVLSLDLTSRCNLNCAHCLADASPNGASIPQDMAISIIDEAKRIGVKELVLGGGEVLLYNNFFDICKYIVSKDLEFAFTTNGTLVSHNIDRFIELRKHTKSFKVGISLDGHTPELHGYFRPKDTFEPIINAIELLSSININPHVICVLNRENIKQIPEILNFLSDLKITNIRLIPFMPVGRGTRYKCEMLSAKEFHTILKQKNIWMEKSGVNIAIHMPWEFLFQPPKDRCPTPCEAGYVRLWIDFKGDILPCAYLTDSIIGNIYRDKIEDIWINSPILNELRDSTMLKGACSTCEFRGGCRGLAQFLKGDYLCTDPYCPIVNQEQ